MAGPRQILAGRSVRFAAAAAACLAALAGTALAAFPQDPPNDPDYAPAEKGGPATCLQKPINGEQHYLYGFMPMCAPAAADPEDASGMSLDRAWKRFTTGRGDTTIAYVEG